MGYNLPLLKAVRRQRGLTQSQLAKLAQTSQAYIAYLERGEKKNPSLMILRRLAKALKVTVAELVE